MSFSTLLKYLSQWLFLFILQIFVLQKNMHKSLLVFEKQRGGFLTD